MSGQLEIGNGKSAISVVAVEGFEPTSLDYQSSALAVELHRDLECTGLDGALDIVWNQLIEKDPQQRRHFALPPLQIG